jgi:DNA-binding NarL/FixJ family response regulator
MPKLTGLDVALEIQKLGIDIKMILLTMHNDSMLIETAMSAGVKGYVLKDNSFEDIEYAIKAVMAGGTFISPSLQANFQKNNKNTKQINDKLSKREIEILTFIAQGATGKEIAKKLFISPKTVETHRCRIKEKLNINRTADLVNYSISMGLILKRDLNEN